MSQTPDNPAENLVGKTLQGVATQWKIVQRKERSADSTGSNFSVGYLAEDPEGKRVFLKALDLSPALNEPNTTLVLEKMTSAFNFEKNLLRLCRDARLNRVVAALDDGQYKEPNQLIPVPFLVFELADGDIRVQKRLDLAFVLRALHHIGVGVAQLHRQAISHQDIKPSNVLIYNAASTKPESKIGDFGRAIDQAGKSPFKDFPIPGDITYAPPEMLYGAAQTEWRTRLGTDIYQYGSLICFLFTNAHINALLFEELHPTYHFNKWRGTFNEVLPHLLASYSEIIKSIEDSVSKLAPHPVNQYVLTAITELCHPDPKKRGDPKNLVGHQNPYSLERYISRFSNFATRAEYKIL